MPKMYISRSVDIQAPADKIYKIITDYNQWRAWSPWLISEPEAKVTVAEDTRSYEWLGTRTGQGNMKILKEEENKSVDMDLIFLKPWKSQADVGFDLSENGETTKVTWVMNSNLPFFLFFMKKMMVALITSDYDRGLSMLKAYAETGTVPSKLEFPGSGSFPGCKYVGIKTECTMEQMSDKMQADIGKLLEYMDTHSDKICGEMIGIYHKWDMVKGIVIYTMAIQVSETPSDVPSGIVTDEIPAVSTHTVRHIGRYQHLGNAWFTIYSKQQAKEFKPLKNVHPFEIYRNNPNEVAEEELITDVVFPVK